MPPEFVPQPTKEANPPSLFMVLSEMAQSAAAGGSEAAADRAFLDRGWPRLLAWYRWLNTTQVLLLLLCRDMVGPSPAGGQAMTGCPTGGWGPVQVGCRRDKDMPPRKALAGATTSQTTARPHRTLFIAGWGDSRQLPVEPAGQQHGQVPQPQDSGQRAG